MGGSRSLACCTSVCGGGMCADKQDQESQLLLMTRVSENILSDPDKLKVVVKAQAIIKGNKARDVIKRQKVLLRAHEMGEFEYGEEPEFIKIL